MTDERHVRASRMLARALRHEPEMFAVEVDAAAMAAEGREFHLSRNGVWLTGPVEPRFLNITFGNSQESL